MASLGGRTLRLGEQTGATVPPVGALSRQRSPGLSLMTLGLLQKTNLRQALIYIHFHTEDRILAQIVENFSHFGHAYAGSTVLVGPES